MNKHYDFSQLGRLGLTQDVMDRMQSSYAGPLDALATGLGNYLFVSGCTIAGGNITDGWLIYSGDLIPFVGGAITGGSRIYVDNTTGQELFADSSLKTVFFQKTARLTAVVDQGQPLAAFRRFTTADPLLADANVLATSAAIGKAYNALRNLFSESEVILSGCVATDTGSSNMTVTSGSAYFAGKVIDVPGYTGVFPAYLTEAGGWVTAIPGSGAFITFDHETSQRLADVRFRSNYRNGQVIMTKALSNRFNPSTGVGKWEWSGWKICDEMQGRVPLGYDRRTSNPLDGVWDAAYNTPWATGGQKQHILSESEIPAHSHGFTGREITAADGTGTNKFAFDPSSLSLVGSTTPIGGGNAHENRQPFRVVVYLERI